MRRAGGIAYGDRRVDGFGCLAVPRAPGRRGRVEGRKRDDPSRRALEMGGSVSNLMDVRNKLVRLVYRVGL